MRATPKTKIIETEIICRANQHIKKIYVNIQLYSILFDNQPMERGGQYIKIGSKSLYRKFDNIK